MQPIRLPLRRAAAALLAVAALAPAVSAQNVRNLAGFQANTLQANDDMSSADAVSLGFASPVNFFGGTYGDVYVNNNGNVTFGTELSTFTPFGLTTNTGTPIIAAFFADVDTRGTTAIPRSNTDPQAYAGSGLVTYGTSTIDGRSAFGVNFFSDCASFTGIGSAACSGLRGVGYYDGRTDRTNIFQLILIDRSDVAAGAFDIEFNYDQIQWETGNASQGSGGLGGNSARVGYSAGTGAAGTFKELAGSGVNGAFLDGGANSLSQLGRLQYQVRAGAVSEVPPVVTATPEPASIALTATGLAGLAAAARRRKRAAA
jgi:hypothetical protein